MSAEATFWAWSMGVKSSAAKLVLLCMADCHNSDTERCDPSAPFICQFTGLDKKTVPVAIKWLCDAGLVSVKHRRGTSSQYTLHISTFPAPVREKGERRATLKIKTPTKNGSTQKRGDPKNGSTQISPRTPPKNGGLPPPKTGVEPTKNLQVGTYNSSDSIKTDSAPAGVKPVDNSFQAIGSDYQAPDLKTAKQLIFNRGSKFLQLYGIDDVSARSFLGMLESDVGVGRTMDAVVVSICTQPSCTGKEIKGFMLGVVANQPQPIPRDWQPSDGTVAELHALNIPEKLIIDARGIFITWFTDMGIGHSSWPRLFKDWCVREWEAAEFQEFQFKRRLAASAGPNYQQPFSEPPGGTL